MAATEAEVRGAQKSARELIAEPLTLPCGLTLPNRLVKCPMQETLASPPLFDPPVETFKNLYTQWAGAEYGLIITGQVQIDLRFLSVPGDVVCHKDSLQGKHFEAWKEWATIAKAGGTPCIVQVAHPGRMSPKGAGVRPDDMQAWCPSSVPVELGGGWLDKMARDKILGIPKAMTLEEIDEVVELWKHSARVAKQAGFDGIQLHGAHGFLLSEFLSPHTNRRTDAYGGDPERRLALLRRLVTEIRAEHPPPFCVGVKLNSADYMDKGRGLEQEEGLGQVRWLIECGMVDFVEISGGNAEQKSSGLHNSFSKKSLDKAPVKKESTRIREAFYTEFAEKVQALQAERKAGEPYVPIQLSGGYRSRLGMADGIESGVTDLIGLGRAAVLEPTLPRSKLVNPNVSDEDAFAISHQIRGQWFPNLIPAKIVGQSIGIQFFYHNMRRLGRGLKSDPNLSLPVMVFRDTLELMRTSFSSVWGGIVQRIVGMYRPAPKLE